MFSNLNLRLDSPAALAAWLSTQPRPLWGVLGSTYHNTFIPDETQWRGAASMKSMARHYEDQGWTSGPHLFLAEGTPYDGIWVMTSPAQPGTHAGACNNRRFGIEVVGNFAERPMTHAQLVLLSEAAAALHDWAGLGPDIVAHRDCMPGRTCPGNAGYRQKSDIQGLLAFAMLRPTPPPPYTEESPILGEPRIDQTSVIQAIQLAHTRRRSEPARPQPRYPDVPSLLTIIGSYYSVCAPLRVNTDLAIAQMLHETDWLCSDWCARPRRNPAGLGVTGEKQVARPADTDGWALLPDGLWHTGLSFESWYHSIPAHVGRLVAYAVPPANRDAAQREAVELALSYRPLPPKVHGSAPTLKPLGKAHNKSGKGWASPGTIYGSQIAKTANRVGGAS